MSGVRKHHQQRRVKGHDLVIDPSRPQVKTAPVHRSRGTGCNVAKRADGTDCGKTALRFHGRFFGCLDHQHVVFAMAAKSRGVKVVLPEVNFEPEETGLEVPELA
jgi:hypothetical protein